MHHRLFQLFSILPFPAIVGIAMDKLYVASNADGRSKELKASRPLRQCQECLDAVAEGVAASEARRVVDHKQVRRWLESWGTDQEKDAPK